jgi:hypothetical protein
LLLLLPFSSSCQLRRFLPSSPSLDLAAYPPHPVAYEPLSSMSQTKSQLAVAKSKF